MTEALSTRSEEPSPPGQREACGRIALKAFIAWLGLCVVLIAAADERAIVSHVLAGKPRGTAITLGSKTRILALHVEPAGHESVGAVVILHAAGGHLNSVGNVQALRLGLPPYGWHTMSVQLPDSDGSLEAWHRRVGRRLSLAIQYLAGEGILNVVVIAQSSAAGAAVQYFREGADAAVTGFVGLSPVYSGGPGKDALSGLSDAWPKQILEIYGDRDLPAVRRLVAAHQHQAQSLSDVRLRQIELGGASHGLPGHAADVVKRVRGWLERNLSGEAVPASS